MCTVEKTSQDVIVKTKSSRTEKYGRAKEENTNFAISSNSIDVDIFGK